MNQSNFRHLLGNLRDGLSLFTAALREVFDESAYSRFLSRNQLTSSRRAYAAFLVESDHAKARRPRCC